jgi:hypothetical protein
MKSPDEQPKIAKSAAAVRSERLATQLRANLQKRKEKARASMPCPLDAGVKPKRQD